MTDASSVLAEALAAGVGVHLQPVVDLVRGTVVGYEALARFPAGLGPAVVFDAARQAGRTAEVEAMALRAALATRPGLPSNTFLTVNVGPDVLDAPEIRAVWRDVSSLAGVVVELTEQVRIESYAALEPALTRLRSLGAMIAVDDAGAGYAGLQHLLALRPDFIKLDREIVAGVDADEAKRALVEVMGTFGSRLDAWLIAEGVETGAELDVLIDLGVPLAQGFLLARPDAGYRQLDTDTAARILRRSTADPRRPLRALLELAPVVQQDSSQPVQVAATLSAGQVAVVVDRWGSPEATIDAEGIVHAARDSGLRVNVDTPVAEAAQRAIVRSPATRFQPLVCTDNAGRYVGVVRIERIIDALARGQGDPGRGVGSEPARS